MTIDDFRRIALAMPGTEELNGMGYPNFRAGRRSFATIEDAVALINFTCDQQAKFVETAPEMFAPATDGWGKWGSTIVRLEAANEATLWDALACDAQAAAELGQYLPTRCKKGRTKLAPGQMQPVPMRPGPR